MHQQTFKQKLDMIVFQGTEVLLSFLSKQVLCLFETKDRTPAA